MDKDRLDSYERFFKLLRRDQEKKFEQYAQTPLCNLFPCGRAFYGEVAGVTDHGQLILRFGTELTPRLKVPMTMCLVRSSAFANYGANVGRWNCTSLAFRENVQAHTSFSDVLPIYFTKDRKTIGCGRIRFELVRAVQEALEVGTRLTFVMLETLPPTALLKNLADYIHSHRDDENLLLRPRMTYDEWCPIDRPSSADVAGQVIRTLDKSGMCVLQGPPGTGKSYTLAKIISELTSSGKSVCVTTQSNASLISLVAQETMKPLVQRGGVVSKTVLSAEEKKKHPFLVPADKDLLEPKGGLLCSTYYSLSSVINKADRPLYDLIVIEEASQAYLTAIAAFMRLGRKCLIVGDPMQLPPVAEMENPGDYVDIDVETQLNGMMTFVCSTSVPSFRMTTSFRLTAASASQTKFFYGGNFSSVQKSPTLFNVPADVKPYFPDEGGTLLCQSEGGSGADCTPSALRIMHQIEQVFLKYYPKRRLAILSPYVRTTKFLQKEFCGESQKFDILVETVNRIQGETVDYTIYYIPLRNFAFAFSENLFNVATSRSRSTTLLLTDMPLEYMPVASVKVAKFLSACKTVEFVRHTGVNRDEVKSYYPGLECLVDQLIDHDISFS